MKMLLLKFLAAMSVLLIFGCGTGGGDGDGVVIIVPASIDMTTSSFLLDTDGIATATITIFARDENNAALEGAVVDISASAGLLDSAQVTTDASGQAFVTFSAGPEKVNQSVTITATSGDLEKTLPIKILGTTIELVADRNSLLTNANDSTQISVIVKDANDSPVPNATIALSSKNGNEFTTSNGTTSSSVSVVTDVNGEAFVTFTAGSTPGIDTISASGLGAETAIEINVTSEEFSITSPSAGSSVAVGDTTNVTLTWIDAAGNPVAGRVINFSTTNGTITSTATTDRSGQARVVFTAGFTASPANITATSGVESDSIQVLIVSENPAKLDLQASPTVIAPSLDEIESSSTLTATVRDNNNQLVSGEKVIFTLIDGPGGGETISPGFAITDSGGQAEVTFTSGSAISAQNGIRIRATLESDNSVFSETTLTIGSQAATIVLGTTNKIRTVSVDGLQIGYALPFSVIVLDNNGNPIPDATVNLGVYPLYFFTGTGTADNPTFTGRYRNEDSNRNGILDPGEDGAQGFLIDGNGTLLENTPVTWYDGSESTSADTSANPITGTPNGRLDPGGVASVPSAVTTGEDGLGAFEISYAKAFGTWVWVELTASTRVTGTLSTSQIIVPLGVQNNDLPYLPSPYGF